MITCPMRFLNEGEFDAERKSACIEKKCAWWDYNNCAIVKIAQSISALNVDHS